MEGREFYAPQSVALDTSGSTPILYVSDTDNNRVLAWKDANGFQSGQKADLQIGQPDLLTTFPGGPGTAYSTGLFRPTGIAVDPSGNLYVADSGNNRVLRYPSPPHRTYGSARPPSTDETPTTPPARSTRKASICRAARPFTVPRSPSTSRGTSG